MIAGLKRDDLKVSAQQKIDDALLLFQNQRFSNAYYLAGYSIELGLKACTAKFMMRDVIPDKKFILNVYQHDLEGLVKNAGLATRRRVDIDKDPRLGVNWAIVAKWDVTSRYETFTIISAQLLIDAILDPKSGVFKWIKQNW